MSYWDFVMSVAALLGAWSFPVILLALTMGIMELAEKVSSRNKHKGVN